MTFLGATSYLAIEPFLGQERRGFNIGLSFRVDHKTKNGLIFLETHGQAVSDSFQPSDSSLVFTIMQFEFFKATSKTQQNFSIQLLFLEQEFYTYSCSSVSDMLRNSRDISLAFSMFWGILLSLQAKACIMLGVEVKVGALNGQHITRILVWSIFPFFLAKVEGFGKRKLLSVDLLSK